MASLVLVVIQASGIVAPADAANAALNTRASMLCLTHDAVCTAIPFLLLRILDAEFASVRSPANSMPMLVEMITTLMPTSP
jgi:hypothetical protein